jgi:hypothetical protein
MSSHKFKVGQLVTFFSRESALAFMRSLSFCRLKATCSKYRIKNTKEPHERVVKEHELGGVE